MCPDVGLPPETLGHGRGMTETPEQSPEAPQPPQQTQEQVQRMALPDRDDERPEADQADDPGPDPSGQDRNAYPRRREATTSEEAMAPESDEILEESAYTSTHGTVSEAVVERQSGGDVSVHDPEGERQVAKANEALDD
jgi:hypothetical protein